MSFDWMSFATGFLERTQEIRDTRQEEAKQFEEEQRQAAQRNAQIISRRRAIADQVTGYANYLQSNGVSNEQLQAVIASGPQAIEQLTSRVQAAVQANGGRPLGSSDVATLISMPEGFTPLDMTTQEFIDQTYGLAVMPTTTEEREFTLLDRLGGRDQMARARERLGRTPMMEGMTIEQINAAAMQGDYQSLIPGTFASIVGQGSSYDFDASTDFTVTFERRLATLQESTRWTETLGMPMEEREAAQAALLEEAMGPIIRMGMTTYGDPFLADQESYLRSIMGDDFMDSLIDAETSPPTREEETPTDTALPETPSVSTETPTPTTEAPQPTVDTTAPTMVTPAVAEPVEAPSATEVRIPEDANTLPEPPADATVRRNGQDYTYEQWQGMTRTERVAAGLPTSQLGAQFYFNRFAAGIGDMPSIDALVGPAGEGDPEQTAAYQALSEQGVDDTSIALLNSHGSDMLNYAIEQGATTDEELFNALTEWGQQNNIVMPFDKSALIYALKSVIDQQP